MPTNDRIEQIELFLIDTPRDAFLNYALAIEFIGLGDDAKAREILEELVDEQPDYFASYYHLGKLYERIGEYNMAESIYEKGLEITESLGEKHAHGELRGAYEELTY